MTPSALPTNPLPRFERPSEAVVYWALAQLCMDAGGRYSLSLRRLAQHCNLSVNTTNRAVLSLTKRGVIQYRRGVNQARPSLFEIPSTTGEKVSPQAPAVAKIAVPIPSDKYNNINNLSLGDKDDRAVVPKQNGDSDPSPEERLAYQLADGLEDRQNLNLYQSYCRRFPADLLLKAYVRAKEPTPDKIRTSRGALFNFLVQLYAKKRTPNDDAGPAAG